MEKNNNKKDYLQVIENMTYEIDANVLKAVALKEKLETLDANTLTNLLMLQASKKPKIKKIHVEVETENHVSDVDVTIDEDFARKIIIDALCDVMIQRVEEIKKENAKIKDVLDKYLD